MFSVVGDSSLTEPDDRISCFMHQEMRIADR
jgi:hypothetical protein